MDDIFKLMKNSVGLILWTGNLKIDQYIFFMFKILVWQFRFESSYYILIHREFTGSGCTKEKEGTEARNGKRKKEKKETRGQKEEMIS